MSNKTKPAITKPITLAEPGEKKRHPYAPQPDTTQEPTPAHRAESEAQAEDPKATRPWATRISEDLYDQIGLYAVTHRITRQELLDQALREFFNKQD